MRRICKDAQHLYDFSKPVRAYRFSYVPFRGTKHIEPPAAPRNCPFIERYPDPVACTPRCCNCVAKEEAR